MEVTPNKPNAEGDITCNIVLTVKEARSVLQSLIRTSAKGDDLTVSMELEDKLAIFLKRFEVC